MLNFVMIAIGGAAGACLRYGMSSWINAYSQTSVPTGTLAVNLLGSFLIGWVWGIFNTYTSVPMRLQLLIITGFLGGFTTFSSFSLENWQLLQQGLWKPMAFYMIVSNIGGILLAFAGFRLAGQVL